MRANNFLAPLGRSRLPKSAALFDLVGGSPGQFGCASAAWFGVRAAHPNEISARASGNSRALAVELSAPRIILIRSAAIVVCLLSQLERLCS